MPREIDKVARGGQHPFAAADDLDAGLGECRLARPALDQFDLELAFEIADLHRQGRLGDRACFRGPAEMPVLGEGFEIAELAERHHADN